MGTGSIAINARYLLHPVTGIQRYAREIVGRLPVDDYRLVEAPAWAKGAKGHLWEQTALRVAARGSLLWNPCQTGPVGTRAQVSTVHDMGTFDHPGSYAPAFAAWYRYCITSVAACARHVVAVSEFTKQRLLHHTKIEPSRVTVVPEGADARFRPVGADAVSALKRRLGLDGDKRIVLSLGSLEPRKNLGRLLHAWKAVGSGEAHGAVLVLVGKQGDPAVFRSLGVAEVPGGVVFTGYLSDDDLPAMYSAASVFVYPSLYEGFGLPVLEAMSCGAPVITSNCASLPEVAGDAALLVDPHSEQQVAQALVRALEDEPWRAQAVEASLAQAQTFSWEAAVTQTRKILEGHA